MGLDRLSPRMRMGALSHHEQRIVEIARALAGNARVLVMDEPTAALTEQEAKLIFRIIRRLKAQAVSIIYISHYLNEVFEISDRIAVLRDGRNAGLFETQDTASTRSWRPCSAASPGDLYRHRRQDRSDAPRSSPSRAWRFRGWLDGVDFTVRSRSRSSASSA